MLFSDIAISTLHIYNIVLVRIKFLLFIRLYGNKTNITNQQYRFARFASNVNKGQDHKKVVGRFTIYYTSSRNICAPFSFSIIRLVVQIESSVHYKKKLKRNFNYSVTIYRFFGHQFYMKFEMVFLVIRLDFQTTVCLGCVSFTN